LWVFIVACTFQTFDCSSIATFSTFIVPSLLIP
jgi:hypothetical protein